MSVRRNNYEVIIQGNSSGLELFANKILALAESKHFSSICLDEKSFFDTADVAIVVELINSTTISVKMTDNEVIISGNSTDLGDFAEMILTLAKSTHDTHVHLDEITFFDSVEIDIVVDLINDPFSKN
jgi:thymidine kinase